jgi:predicted Zn-dependent peptidase
VLKDTMEHTRLDNGIRVVSEELPHLASVAIGVWVENGSRYEAPEIGGISHYIEHLLFKGTERRTAAQISEEIEGVGGSLNAVTGKEHTCYYAKVLHEHLPLAFDLLADIFLNSRFDPEEIERERGVILQEIAQVLDTPDEHIHDVFNAHFWRGHPLSRPICGTAETVSELERKHFLTFLRERYGTDRTVVAAAGRLRHDDLVGLVDRAFSRTSSRLGPVDGAPPVHHGGLVLQEKALEQVHVCVGLPAVSQTDPSRYRAFVLDTALGGGMSSRLFQEVRERRGRAYAIQSFLSTFRDTGYLGVYAGTNPEWAPEVMEVIVAEIRRLARDGLGAEELERAKNQLKGNILLGLETSTSRMNRLATCELYFGRDIPLDEVAREIDAVDNDGVVELARRLLAAGPLAAAVLGDLRGTRVDESLLGT